jgi:hypothetical protein
MQLKAVALAVLLAGLASPASAACSLAIDLAGGLGISGDGKYVGSDQPGGLFATMLVGSTGSSTLTVQPPVYTQMPSGYTGTGDIMEVSYFGVGLLGGINQPYTAVTSQATVPNLLGLGTVLVTFNARATTATGFRNGTYQMKTVVTCS